VNIDSPPCLFNRLSPSDDGGQEDMRCNAGSQSLGAAVRRPRDLDGSLMPHLRFSHARQPYACSRCSGNIAKRHPYFRDEPFPFARMRGTATVRYLCLSCVVGPAEASAIVESLSERRADANQLPLGFEVTSDGKLFFPPRVELVDISRELLAMLEATPDRLRELTADQFELLICERLAAFGYDFERVGAHAFRKDGGIDLLAWQRTGLIPLLIGVQAKHAGYTKRKVGPDAVRDLTGTVRQHGFNAGVLVTNTTFTPDARWFACKQPALVQLRDIQDLRRWLKGEFSREAEWRDLPTEMELCPGVRIELPR
jgi:hypothetical protein